MNQKPRAVALLAFCSCLFPFPALAVSFDKIYLFGDSLSDPGNLYNLTRAANRITSDIPVIPSVPPYSEEGAFSNGPVWVDYLASDLGLDLTPVTELVTTQQGLSVNTDFNGAIANRSVNFAFSGSQSGLSGGNSPIGSLIPGLLTQTSFYTQDLAKASQQADQDALYIIWTGANDYQTTPGFPIPDGNPVEVVGNIEQSIETLSNLGAQKFLVLNLPDLGTIPQSLSPNSPVPADQLTYLSTRHNQVLADTLRNLRSQSNLEITSVDIFSIYNRAIKNPAEFGFTNVTDSCLNQVAFPTANQCSSEEEDDFLFWDPIHPTTATHELIADFALEELKTQHKSVPEPSTSVFLLFIGGGFCLRQWLMSKL